jgi:hypothetical protein
MDGGIAQTIETPMSDADIKEYLPDARIIKYSELHKYPTLEALLPNVHSFCILLYEDSPNTGHWTVVSRPRAGFAEYFDSYGGYPDGPLQWTDKQTRVGLGEGEKMLSQLFKACPDQVVYNKIHYQKDGAGINDCGRWCVWRTLKMKSGMDLNQFHRYVMAEKNKMKLPFDAVVSKIIP